MIHSDLETVAEPAASPAPSLGARMGGAPLDPREMEVELKIAQSVTFMKEHLDQPLQASVLAERAHVSLSHYFALFKRRTGATPIGYFIHLRIRRACELLQTTALTVKEVAAALGYEDPFYFSRVFKATVGQAPTEYRAAQLLLRGSSRSGADAPTLPLSYATERPSHEQLLAEDANRNPLLRASPIERDACGRE